MGRKFPSSHVRHRIRKVVPGGVWAIPKTMPVAYDMSVLQTLRSQLKRSRGGFPCYEAFYTGQNQTELVKQDKQTGCKVTPAGVAAVVNNIKGLPISPERARDLVL
jgi:hypothetical protein